MRDYDEGRGGYRGGRGGGGRDRDRGGGGYGGGHGGGGSFEKPVKEGEEYDVTIEAVGAKGDGICKINNFVVFVPGVRAGERLRIRIDKVLNRFALASSTGAAGASAPAEAEGSDGASAEGEAMEEQSGEGQA